MIMSSSITCCIHWYFLVERMFCWWICIGADTVTLGRHQGRNILFLSDFQMNLSKFWYFVNHALWTMNLTILFFKVLFFVMHKKLDAIFCLFRDRLLLFSVFLYDFHSFFTISFFSLSFIQLLLQSLTLFFCILYNWKSLFSLSQTFCSRFSDLLHYFSVNISLTIICFTISISILD